MLKSASTARLLSRVLRQSPPAQLLPDRFHLTGRETTGVTGSSDSISPFLRQCRRHSSGSKFDGGLYSSCNRHILAHHCTCRNVIPRAFFCTVAVATEGEITDSVKELFDKIHKSVNDQRTAPPNAWLWSLIENCANHKDIKLLFDSLQRLRRFRLSNLRIHENFNDHLCREITKACLRVGAIDFGKMALWNHNVYGLTPSIGSAHHLLMYAKQNNDANLMIEVMKLLKKNDLQLQAGTADIVFSICYNTDRWDLITKYSKRFIKAGVKLRETSLDVWMEFSAKRGDTESLWYIEKLRSASMKKHSLLTGFSCAKGFLLERKPENAAATIHVLSQTLSDAKKAGIVIELQKLVSDWTLEVIKRQEEEDRKAALAAALQADIPAMISGLVELGLEVNVDTKDLLTKDLSC